MEFTNLLPLSNKITIKELPKSEKTSGGIIKVNTENEPLIGEVVEVGRGVPLINETGQFAIIPLELKKGDKVLFPPNIAVPVELPNGEKLLLLTEDHILGIIN